MKRPIRYAVLQHVVNPLLRLALRSGNGPEEVALLQTVGRRSNARHETPIAVVEDGGQRWLVSIYGEVGWVQNARANAEAELVRGDSSEHVTLIEVPSAEHTDVVEAVWTMAPGISKFFARPFFRARPGDPRIAWKREAAHHPVFRVDPN